MISQNETHSFSLKAEPVEVSRNDHGDDDASYIVQIKSRKGTAIEYAKWRVSGADCKRGYGTLIWEDLDGSNSSKNNYVQDGENAISHIGSLICEQYIQLDNEREERARRCPRELARAYLELESAKNQEASGDDLQHAANIAAASAELAVLQQSCDSSL